MSIIRSDYEYRFCLFDKNNKISYIDAQKFIWEINNELIEAFSKYVDIYETMTTTLSTEQQLYGHSVIIDIRFSMLKDLSCVLSNAQIDKMIIDTVYGYVTENNFYEDYEIYCKFLDCSLVRVRDDRG
jgi:hypothetical protein